jgi:polyribonucleotide nucleotidyltransferase
VSEIARHRVQDVRDEIKEGEQLLVKVISIDPSGKIRLSRKALLAEEEGGEAGGGDAPQEPAEHAPRPPRPHGDRGPGGRGGGRPGGPGGRDRRR